MKAFAALVWFCAAAHISHGALHPAARTAGSLVRVPPGGNLQAALDQAMPGDAIELPAGATFVGNFVLPRKSGNRHITVRTAPVEGLPEAGARIRPEHSGLLAVIQSPNGSPALRTAPGAHHWRLVLLELGPNRGGAGDILALGDGSLAQSSMSQVPHDLIVDRCYIHGDPQRGQKRGIALNSASTTITGSHISDIKVVGQDAQAIGGWNGPGPFLIENNYLEASGENVMLGGATPGINGLVPSDVTFRQNHVARPVSWRAESWTVKNLFELKNARRVLVEGNLFENNWRAAQPGYAIVLTPRGEGGAAPWATVEDVTFRYNVVRNVAAVFNLLARDDAGPSGTLRRVRIAHNLMYDVDREVWGGNGVFLQIGQGPSDIAIEHNTVVQTGNMITAYGGTREAPAVVERFVFRGNLLLHNANGVIGQGFAIGNDSLSKYFPGAQFHRNVIAGGSASRYPADNLFPAVDWFFAQFENHAGRDYRLRQASALRGAASDGGDLGVSFMALAAAFGSHTSEGLALTSPPDAAGRPQRHPQRRPRAQDY
jgi:hypothetical protein